MKGAKKDLAKLVDKNSLEATKLQKLIVVLDKRQLSYKISANSMYGSMGVRRGYLPFLPGAMCTTAWGRRNIQLAAERLQEVHKGTLVYGDTDSCYVNFPQFNNAQELWDFCLVVEEDISSIFPPPMRMAFEEVIYWRFLILTKKRYMYLDCGRDGKISEKIGKKGVLLARRDNSSFIRMIYEEVVEKIFKRCPWKEVMIHLCDRYNDLLSAFFCRDDFVITKSIGEISDYAIMSKTTLDLDIKKRKKRIADLCVQCHECEYENVPDGENVVKCSLLFDKYTTVDPLSFSADEKSILKKLGDTCHFCGLEEWRARKRGLPAHIQLAEKMRKRGQRVDPGTRLEYLVSTNGGIKAKLFWKLEHPDYYKERTTAIKIEYLYYLKLLANSMDQLIEVAYKKEKFTMQQYKLRVIKNEVCRELESLFRPAINFKNTTKL